MGSKSVGGKWAAATPDTCFLGATEQYRIVWRVEIDSDDVPELGFELFAVRQFEDQRPMWLNVVGGPEALHCGLGYSHTPTCLVIERVFHSPNPPAV
jgi:hypothetical protein